MKINKAGFATNKGFTLAETLIMVAIVGIIAIITMVSLRNMRPDKDFMMIRKAYSEVAKVVADLANDDELYPVGKNQAAYKPEDIGKYFASIMQRTNLSVFDGIPAWCGYGCDWCVCNSVQGPWDCNSVVGSGPMMCSGCKGRANYNQNYGCICAINEDTCANEGKSFYREMCDCVESDSPYASSPYSGSGNESEPPANYDPCAGYTYTSPLCNNTTMQNACKAAGGKVSTSYGECSTNCNCTGIPKSGDCTSLIATLNSGTYSSLSESYKNSLLTAAGCTGVDSTNNSLSDNVGASGDADPCEDNPASCINSPIVPSVTSTDFSGNTLPQGSTANQGDFVLPNFIAYSRGYIFRNTSIPDGAAFSSKNKFAYSFSHSFETRSEPSCNKNSNKCTFTTKDGMYWEIEDNFQSGSDAIIMVDINGNGTPPDSQTSGNIDRFKFRVDAGGAISLYGNPEDPSLIKATRAISSRKFRKTD